MSTLDCDISEVVGERNNRKLSFAFEKQGQEKLSLAFPGIETEWVPTLSVLRNDSSVVKIELKYMSDTLYAAVVGQQTVLVDTYRESVSVMGGINGDLLARQDYV